MTVLIGSNNTGKSSLIAPLLLLKQTLRSRSTDVALVTRGDVANVGSFRDMVFRHDATRTVGLDLRWHTHTPKGTEEPVGAYPPGEIRLDFSEVDGRTVLQRSQIVDLFGRNFVTRTRLPSGKYSLRDLPRKRATRADAAIRRSERAAVDELPRHFLFEGDSVFEALIRTTVRRGSHDAEQEALATAIPIELSPFAGEYMRLMSVTDTEVNNLLRQTKYLGPLREPLRRVYEVSGDPPRDVGSRGEHAPEILFRNEMLLGDVQTWLSHFGLGRSLRTRAGRDDSFSLYFPAGGGRPSVNLADVGFGASQILPMIVQGVAADEDNVLIMEQPEIHLNPRMQSIIADFLAYMAKSGRGALVETHSEHLVLRLRTLIAAGELDESDVALYFVDRDGGVSTVRPVPVSDDGHIEASDWPPGFFQDAVREALALASAQDRPKPRRRKSRRA